MSSKVKKSKKAKSPAPKKASPAPAAGQSKLSWITGQIPQSLFKRLRSQMKSSGITHNELLTLLVKKYVEEVNSAKPVVEQHVEVKSA